MMLAVTEKCEFEYWDQSVIIAVFAVFGLVVLWCRDLKQWFFNRALLYQCKASDADVDGRNQTSSDWENWVWMSIFFNNDNTFWTFRTIRMIAVEGTKPPFFQWKTLVQMEGSDWVLNEAIEPRIFGENYDAASRNSILIALFGIPSMWRGKNDIFQKCFRSKVVISVAGELGILKKKLIPKSWKKFNYLRLELIFTTDV